MESLDRLISRLNRLPGIGIKTAQRLAYHIISLPDEDAAALANSIEDAHRLVHFCPICGNYTENEVCEICSDPKRSSDTLCVVKDARDVIFMERMREYHGRYHVLGGVLSPMDGIGPEMLRINELCKRIECEKVKEVILATNPDVEGETTANYEPALDYIVAKMAAASNTLMKLPCCVPSKTAEKCKSALHFAFAPCGMGADRRSLGAHSKN